MCDTAVAIKDDGVFFAKNSDRDPNEAQILEWHPATTHSRDQTVQATWIEIPQAAQTYATAISRPWWMWGAEMGANERGVVIGNEAVFTKESLKGDLGLLGMDMLRLALERSASRDEATETIVSLLETYGQVGPCSYENPGFSYHNSFLIADPNGATVLETAGKHWAVEEVSGPARSISNGLTIPGFVEKFSDPLRSTISKCKTRAAITQAGAASAKSVIDLIGVLGDNGTEGGPAWSPLTGSLIGPNVHGGGLVSSSQTVSSWIADLRSDPIHWVTGTSDPALSLFKPVWVDRPADLGPDPTNKLNPGTLWWSHELLHRYALYDWQRAFDHISPQLAVVQEQWLADPPQTGEAFEASKELSDQFRLELLELPLHDTRPRWVQEQWAKYNAQALP